MSSVDRFPRRTALVPANRPRLMLEQLEAREVPASLAPSTDFTTPTVALGITAQVNAAATAATVTSVTSTTANGTYGVGATINVTVNFLQAVTLAGGNLTVNLDTGGSVVIAPFTNKTSVSGTYTVAAGQNSSDLNSNSPLVLATGATLKDASGTNATLTIPTGQSLASSKAIVVDTTAPTVTISSPSATTTNHGTITYTITYADANFKSSTLTAANVTLNKTGTANGVVTVSSGTGLTRTVTISGITGSGTLSITLAANTASDNAGNQALAAGPSSTFSVTNVATLAVGGSDGSVRTINASTGAVVSTVRPLDFSTASQYKGLVQVALGDLNGDGVPDLFVAAASASGVQGLNASKAGKVFVYDGAAVAKGTLTLLHTFTPFANHVGPGQNGAINVTGQYTNGLNISVGDVNGDGKIDLIAGTRGGTATVEYGRMIVVSAGAAANGSADTFIGSDKQGLAPFGSTYSKGVVIAAGNLDGVGGKEIAVTRGDAVAATNPNKTVKLKAFQLNTAGTTLAELKLSGTTVPLAPFTGVGSGSKVIDGGADLAFTDQNADGKDELVFSALDSVTAATNVQVRVAAFSVNTATGVATAVSIGTGPSKSYLVGKNVVEQAITSIDPTETGTRNLALITQSGTSGVQYLAPLSGSVLTGGFSLNILKDGVTIDGV